MHQSPPVDIVKNSAQGSNLNLDMHNAQLFVDSNDTFISLPLYGRIGLVLLYFVLLFVILLVVTMKHIKKSMTGAIHINYTQEIKL